MTPAVLALKIGGNSGASGVPFVVLPKGGTECAETSSEKPFRPFDMHGLRRSFPDVWAKFLRLNFRDARHVAYMFDVTERTAQNWLHATNAPRPEFVLTVVKRMPLAAAMLLGAA